MIRHIDGAYVAAQVRLVRQIHKGTILIVEGSTDARVFDSFIDKAGCDIEVGFKKSNVIDALDRLEEEGIPGIIALIDADFDRLFGKAYELVNLYLTDKHDLDLTIFVSAALDKYLDEYADKELCKKDFPAGVSAIRDKIINASLPFAYCRLVSERFGFDLSFRDLKHDELISLDDLSTKTEALIATLIGRSRTQCTEEKLGKCVASEAARRHDPYQLANGHDVAAILGIALRRLIGRRRDVHTWGSEVESGLRLAFSWEELVRTEIFGFMRKWEAENGNYRILRQ